MRTIVLSYCAPSGFAVSCTLQRGRQASKSSGWKLNPLLLNNRDNLCAVFFVNFDLNIPSGLQFHKIGRI